MREILDQLIRWRDRGDEHMALATVLATRRSAPRPVGSKLAVSERGELAGSVSGGCVESEVAVAARDVLAAGEPQVLTYGITDEQAGSVGLPCGGEIDVGIERVALSDLERLAEASAPNRLVVFGAVDIAEALCRGAKELGWDTVVADPRATFATRERIAAADELLVEWPDELLERIEVDEKTAVVVLTHEERFDVPALARALRSDAFYVGAIGSRRAQERRRGLLLEEGLTEEEVDRISGPTGLDVGAETPAETAVSILAEILAVRAGRSGGRLRNASGRIHAEVCAFSRRLQEDRRVPEPLLNVDDYARAAEARLDPGVFGYVVGGADDEWTLRENRAAFQRWILRPRMLVDVSRVTTATTVLGTESSMPVFVAPTAFQRTVHPEGEVAMARGAAAAGTGLCLSTFATATIEEVAEAAPEAPRWFQLYWSSDRGFVRDVVERAEASGYGAVVATVDLPCLGRRERDLQTGFAVPEGLPVPAFVALAEASRAVSPEDISWAVDDTLTWQDLEWLRSVSSLPTLVKGILTAEDALLAAEAGADGVVVSNHGGRQLDGVAAALDALPEVVEAVGDRVAVLMDGGIRRGTDVVKALALGAQAVLAGRAPLWGLAVGGADGVQHVLELLRGEIELALALCGCASPADVTRKHVGLASA